MESFHCLLIHKYTQPRPVHGHRQGAVLAKGPRVPAQDFIPQSVRVPVELDHRLVLHVDGVGGEGGEGEGGDGVEGGCEADARAPDMGHHGHLGR